MGLPDRALHIILRPRSEWSVIKTEQSSHRILFRYVALLTLPPIVAITYPVYRDLLAYSKAAPVFRSAASYSLMVGLGWYLLNLVNVFIIGALFQALFPAFAATDDKLRGLKIAAYAETPLWIAITLTMIPYTIFDWISLAALLYSFYLMYLAIVILMEIPRKKAALYASATIFASGTMIVILDSSLITVGDYLVKLLWKYMA
jgi:hypothetical protein